MTIFFTIATIVLIIARVLLGHFAATVGWFAPLLTPLTVAAVIVGIVAFMLIAIKIYGEVRKAIGKKKEKDE